MKNKAQKLIDAVRALAKAERAVTRAAAKLAGKRPVKRTRRSKKKK